MPRIRNILLVVGAAAALSTGGQLYRQRAESSRQAVAALPKAQFRIPYLAYDRTPLREVVADLQTRSGVSIRVDWEALGAAGVSPESPVEARLFNVRWSKALNIALDQFRTPGFGQGLVYDVQEDGSVVVSTERQRFRLAYLEAYDQRDMFKRIPPGHEEDLEELFTDAVDPQSWVRHGGPFGLCRVRHGWVLVYQTPENQRTLQILLEQLAGFPGPSAPERERKRLLARLRGEKPPPKTELPR